MRKTSRRAGLALLLLALVAAHYGLRPVFGWRAGVDFLLVGVLLVAVRIRPGAAAMLGFAAGLASDALSPAAFGAGVAAMTVVAAGSSWLKARFFAEHLLLTGAFIFAGKLAFDAVYLFAEGRLSGGALLAQLGVWSVLSALVTAIVGLVVLVMFRPFTDIARQPL
jgi:rod shape-determining protein MreD